MNQTTEGNPEQKLISARDWLPDLSAFVLGLALTWFLRWEVRDLVWSLWLSSLVIGYATIVISIARGAGKLTGAAAESGTNVPTWFKSATVFGALLLLLFFTFHFGVFHLVHSVFLNLFFPVEGDGTFSGFGPGSHAGRDFPSVHMYLTVLGRYWPFLLSAVIAERHSLLNAAPSLDMMGPYRNVLRMHLLIFFFAFSAFLHLQSFLVYLVVFAVYFFPFRLFRRKI